MNKAAMYLIMLLLIYSSLFADTEGGIPKYTIHKGDILSIHVMEYPEFSFPELVVLPDGYIQYPVIGSILVEGLTLDALNEKVSAVVSQYITNPQVTVFVDQLFNHSISILGNVNKPGTYQVFEPVDLLFAIALAGGIKENGDCKIHVIHPDGSRETVRFKNLTTLYQEKAKVNRITVLPYDTITIEQPKKINWSIVTACISLGALVTNIYTNFK